MSGGKLHGLDLFSGIGGLTIALSPWVQPIAYCESDRFCQALLLERGERGAIPYAPIWDDIRTLRGITFRLLIFYTADSLARISALRDAERAWTESGAAFSSSSCDSSRNAAQVSFSLKTSPPSQLAADVLSSGRLPNSGMIVGGQFYPLPKLARLTSENGGGSWPTPRAHEAGITQEIGDGRGKNGRR